MLARFLQRKSKKNWVFEPEKFTIQIAEDNLAKVEAMQFILAVIIDEENKKETNKLTNELRIG
jgi:hypothetical protein